MKCICGYENRDGEFDDNTLKIIRETHKEKFIKIEGNFTIEEDYVGIYRTRIFACPECNTLKMKS